MTDVYNLQEAESHHFEVLLTRDPEYVEVVTASHYKVQDGDILFYTKRREPSLDMRIHPTHTTKGYVESLHISYSRGSWIRVRPVQLPPTQAPASILPPSYSRDQNPNSR